jgi:hypothetical protein
MCDRAPTPVAPRCKNYGRGPSRRREETSIKNCDPNKPSDELACRPEHASGDRASDRSRAGSSRRLENRSSPDPAGPRPRLRLPCSYPRSLLLLLFRRCDGCCRLRVRSACSVLTLSCSIIVACRHVETRGARARAPPAASPSARTPTRLRGLPLRVSSCPHPEPSSNAKEAARCHPTA